MNKHIHVIHGKLILYKILFPKKRHIALIIIPRTLRRSIFNHYQYGPTEGHMGQYKTLFRIRNRFFWPTLRLDIQNWVKQCSHCVAYDIWTMRQNELYFSWPITSPFYIMYIDLWVPGELISSDGKKQYVMNCLCDMTQFVISIIAENPTASLLAKLFAEQVIFTFGMVSVIVVDADSKFKK